MGTSGKRGPARGRQLSGDRSVIRGRPPFAVELTRAFYSLLLLKVHPIAIAPHVIRRSARRVRALPERDGAGTEDESHGEDQPDGQPTGHGARSMLTTIPQWEELHIGRVVRPHHQ